MDAINNINQTVAQQNAAQAEAAKEAGKTGDKTKETPEKPKLDKAASKEVVKVKGKEAPKVEVQKPEERKTERTERLRALDALAKQTQKSFVDGQQARQARQTADAEVARLKAESDAARNELASAVKDPLTWLESKGVKARALAERIAKGENPGDDIKKLQQQIIDLEAKNEQARQDWQKREKQAQAQAAYEQAKAGVIKTFDASKDKLPTLHAVMDGPDEIISEFIAYEKAIYESKDPEIQAYLTSGGQYSVDEVFEALEAKWKKKASKLTPAQQAVVQAATNGQTTQTPTKKPTLTPGGSSTVGTLPADFKKLSPKEQVKFLADQYRQLKKI